MKNMVEKLRTRTSQQDAIFKSLTPEERLHWSIVHRKKEGVEKDIDFLIENRGTSIPI